MSASPVSVKPNDGAAAGGADVAADSAVAVATAAGAGSATAEGAGLAALVDAATRATAEVVAFNQVAAGAPAELAEWTGLGVTAGSRQSAKVRGLFSMRISSCKPA